MRWPVVPGVFQTVWAVCLLGPWMPGPSAGRVAASDQEVDFGRTIRPILAANCFDCHGPDDQARKAGLRLDRSEGLFGQGKGGWIVVPGKPEESELFRRITHPDPSRRMPPSSSGKNLAEAHIELIRRWIEQGARWEEHWAFRTPSRPAVPQPGDQEWVRNPIDSFVLQKLEAQGISPAPEADRYTLIRRVYLDLIGLPPSPEEVEAFLADPSPDAYERLVDRLLNSPAFGERWARLWLDLARYADTQGYEKDNRRTIWRYRDWVIEAFNRDMPFDQFTIEQIAGDLLPHPTLDQLIATAFHRNTMTNTEGGTDDEEFRVAAVVDRVNTTMQVWMGLTFGCAQCHNHKYDPIAQREYYELFAFFNNTADNDQPDESPTIPTPTRDQLREQEALQQALKAEQEAFEAPNPEKLQRFEAWVAETQGHSARLEASPWYQLGPILTANGHVAWQTPFGPEKAPTVDLQAKYRLDGKEYGWREAPEIRSGVLVHWPEIVGAVYLARRWHAPRGTEVTFYFGSDDAIQVWLDGEELWRHDVQRAVGPDQDQVQVTLPPGHRWLLVKVVNYGGPSGFYFRTNAAVLPPEVASIFETPREAWPEAQRQMLFRYWLTVAPELQAQRERIAALQKKLAAIVPPTTPIMQELPPEKSRKTYLFIRGSFLQKGEEVSPATPAIFHPFRPEWPKNRLGLAYWLVDPSNPLTARVMVNRLWEVLWGRGLVVTLEDFGTQGTLPTYPELLDWLATEWVAQGWSVKAILRIMVTSSTYRQSSTYRPELESIDPYNDLLARGPRFRLEAETIRDQALAAAGLLSRKMFGPSVMPHQPEGVWQIVYSNDQWVLSPGEDRYRRSVYTFLRRTSPHPAMVIFDAPSREVCTVRRLRTNTSLQALVGLNDPQFIEAAQGLARRVLRENQSGLAERVEYLFRLCLVHPPSSAERNRLLQLYKDARSYLENLPADHARQLATNPLGPLPKEADPVEHAAWTVLANVVLNLDETLTKE
jgi:mono/diheme cytochrome c family protein